jgi:hypothetical protein
MHAIDDSLQRFVPRHTGEAPLALASLADRGMEQPVRTIDALAEFADLRADVSIGDGVPV